MLIGSSRLGFLSQVPENFDKLSQAQQMKILTDLPPEGRQKALAEYLSKKTPAEVWDFWNRLIYAYQNKDAFGKDSVRLFATTAGSILYDGLVLSKADRASTPLRAAAHAGSIGIWGLASFHAYKLITNPVSPDWVKIVSAFVGVFATVGAIGHTVELFSRPGVPAPVYSPMTAVAAAISGRGR